ncbi:HD domain-containing phosphohydrolase [Paradesulfitobacterium ferrireducens]|uniref:HD domain-containing phosphohydrolase n=1 Tax=Paradesulfitobacterium ferrireducens TaxID=2816476 RepID=UPI001A8E4044|nr:HD domain-containing phosphohydrolase [Paradesulfitobacterium ferrireducens]
MPPRFRIKLRGQLLLFTGLLVLVPLLLVGYLVDQRVSAAMTEQALSHNAHVGSLVQTEVKRFVETEEQALAVAAASADLWEPSLRQQHLEQLYGLMAHWKRVYIADTNTGKILNSSPGEDISKLPAIYDARLRDWYHRALVNPGVSVSEIYPDTVTGEDMITFSTVVRDEDGNLVGVLAADLTRDSLRKSLQEKIAISTNVNLWLVDPLGHFLLKPENPNVPPVSAYSSQFINELQKDQIVSQTKIPEVGWLAVVSQDSETALGEVHRLSLEIAWVTFLFLGLAILGVLYYVYRLTKPIDVLLQRIRAIEQGACWRDFPPMRVRFDEIGEVAQAFDKVTEELQELLRDVITTLTTTLDARDPYTRHHSERVSIYAHLLAQHLNWPSLEAENVLRASLMHDVGKIGVPEQILNKPGPLTPEEYEIMKTHSQGSFDILLRIPFYVKLGIAEMVLEHHERWDGKGYPLGLKGTDILPGARVMAIADAFDAMTSDRAYRKALSLDDALRELQRGAGKQFDPEMVEVFLSIPRPLLVTCISASSETQMNRVPLTAV